MFVLILVAIVCMVTFHPTSGTPSSVVETQLGQINGRCTAEACQYLNIPYAEPFSRRFEASSTRYSTYDNGVGSGDQYGPACIQTFSYGIVDHQSEDCLSLNIFAPSNYSSSPTSLPVMVWVHGGGFLTGSAGVDYYGFTFNGTSLAAHNVLVITIQYRLGIFGFLQQPDGTGGANGFGDMVSALEWVQSHIHSFNGDPSSVTIFGESAGSVAVCVLAHLPSSRGLFHRVIAESGSCYPSGDVMLNKTEAATVRADFLDLLNISLTNQDVLLTIDPQELVTRTQQAVVPDPNALDTFTPLFISGIGQPSIDGDILPDAPIHLPTHPVDLLHGYNSGEVKVAPPNGIIPNGPLTYFGKYLGHEAAEHILSQYPNGPKTNAEELIADACLRCNTIRFAQRIATQNKNSQAYLYMFDNPQNASFHGAELPAVFGTADSWSGPDGAVNTSEVLVQKIQTIWTQFAKGMSLKVLVPKWKQVEAAINGEKVVHSMVLGDDEEKLLKISIARCSAWQDATDKVGGWITARMCSEFYGV